MAKTIGELKVDITADSSGLTKGISAAKKTMAVAGSAIIAGSLAMGAAILKTSSDSTKGLSQIQAATGATNEEMANYRKVMDGVVANNYGDGFEDVGYTIGLVKQQLDGLTDESLQTVVESAYLMRDVFDQDINESIRGANALVQAFGLDSEEAFNIMAQGAQNGLNQNLDLADQLSEYAPLWASMGFSVEEMMNGLANGADEGAYQIDFLNDAMKEFGIRTKDNSKATNKAFKDLGLDAVKFGKAFAEGGEEARDAFDDVMESLFSMQDPLEQNEIGVALFGTKFEDMGIDAIRALTDVQGELSLTTDALTAMADVKYESLADNISGIKNQLSVLFSGGEIDEVKLEKDITKLVEGVGETIEKVLPTILETVPTVFIPALEGVMRTSFEALDSDFFLGLMDFGVVLGDAIYDGDTSKIKEAVDSFIPTIEDEMRKMATVLDENLNISFISMLDLMDFGTWLGDMDADISEAGGIYSHMYDVGVSIADQIKRGIIVTFGDIGDTINEAWGETSTFFGGIISDMFNIGQGMTASLKSGIGGGVELDRIMQGTVYRSGGPDNYNNTTINSTYQAASPDNDQINMADYENKMRRAYA